MKEGLEVLNTATDEVGLTGKVSTFSFMYF